MDDPNMDDPTVEGWYLDPYGIHEQRWMSVGRPTSLVRDSGTESHDGPPDRPLPGRRRAGCTERGGWGSPTGGRCQ